MTTTTTTHIEAAAEAIRQHLHERPFGDDPAMVYSAIADMQDIARRLADSIDGAGRAVRVAGESDDGRAPTRIGEASDALDRAHDLLVLVANQLGEAQNAAGHLIWTN